MDYATNIRAILASYYVGTGGLDIGMVNAIQGIEGTKNWETIFTRHSSTVCDAILKVMGACFENNLKEEVERTFQETGHRKIAVSFDMGWQKKGTGHNYDSNSGHAYFIGCRTGQVIDYLVYSKKCSKCDAAVAMGEEPMAHENCPRNYLTGSSKAMEASAALQLLVALHDRGISIEFIVSDDDSTMRATLQHIGTHKNGKLRLDVLVPTFLCDPSHRIKVMVKDIFVMALSSDAKCECKKIDALRLKKYIGCMIAKSKMLPFPQFKKLSKAPIEHLFGCHEWCSCDWCFAA